MKKQERLKILKILKSLLTDYKGDSAFSDDADNSYVDYVLDEMRLFFEKVH